ncbi:MAG: DsrE family protein [Persephonella sp.]|nr:DsrE family protein [Persephonella sp.]
MNLLIVLASNPYSHDFNTAVKLATAALERNHKTKIFFMGNGNLLYSERRNQKSIGKRGKDLLLCPQRPAEKK